MFHPLLPNTADLTPAELENKINDLTKKYWIAARSGNGGLCNQILVALESYKFELQNKNLNNNKIPTRNGDADLDGLININ
jgi:hypothetical protein